MVWKKINCEKQLQIIAFRYMFDSDAAFIFRSSKLFLFPFQPKGSTVCWVIFLSCSVFLLLSGYLCDASVLDFSSNNLQILMWNEYCKDRYFVCSRNLCDSDIELGCLLIASFKTFFIRFMSFADFFSFSFRIFFFLSFFYTLHWALCHQLELYWFARLFATYYHISSYKWLFCCFVFFFISHSVRSCFFPWNFRSYIQFDVRFSRSHSDRLVQCKKNDWRKACKRRWRNNIVHQSRIKYNIENTISNKEKRCITIKVVSSLNI